MIDLPEQGPPEALLALTRQAASHAVRAGQMAPPFHLADLNGERLTLIDLVGRGPLVVSFYRGVWCDFCDAALERLAVLDAAIRDLGATHVAIGPPPGDAMQRERLASFPMPVLVDRGLKVTAAYGLAIPLPEALHDHYARIGYVPAKTGPSSAWMISAPATYVIDRLGKVVLTAIDVDYRKRMEPAELLRSLQGLARRA